MSSDMLHLANVPFSPFRVWMQEMWLKTIKGLKLINSILFNKEKSISFPLITFASPLFLCVLQHLISLSSHCRHRCMSALSPPSPSITTSPLSPLPLIAISLFTSQTYPSSVPSHPLFTLSATIIHF